MPFLVIDSSLPLGDGPPVNELLVVIILCNVDQHTVSREKLVIPQQIGVKAKDGDISWQAAEHPVCVFPADDRLPPDADGMLLLRPNKRIGCGVPYRDGALPPGRCIPSGGRAAPERSGIRYAGRNGGPAEVTLGDGLRNFSYRPRLS